MLRAVSRRKAAGGDDAGTRPRRPGARPSRIRAKACLAPASIALD